MDKNCIFCKIINKEFDANIIYEDDDIIAFLDKFPSNLGHTLIVPKKHIKDIFDIDYITISKIFSKALDISNSLKSILGTDNINILQNNGPIAGQTIFHFHLHVIPRFENDDVSIGWSTTTPNEDDVINLLKKLKTNEV